MTQDVQLIFERDAIPSMAGYQVAEAVRRMQAERDGCEVEITITAK